MPCVTADYCSINLHIDIVVYRKNGGNYELAVGKRNSITSNREWSPSDPKGLIDHLNRKLDYIGSSDIKLSQFKRLVRYIKRWRDEKFEDRVGKKIFSIGLAVMMKDQFSPCLNVEGKPNDLQAMRDSVKRILNGNYFQQQPDGTYRVKVDLPVSPFRNIFENSSVDTGTQLRNKMNAMLNKLDNALSEDTLQKQCKILHDLFGDDFEEYSESNNNVPTKAIYSSAGTVGTSQGA
jgi:hypothetical protein